MAGGGLAVDVSSTLRRRVFSVGRARRVAHAVLRSERVRHAMISIVFVSTRKITELNARYLHRRRRTDVIAFGFGSGAPGGGIVGDIYICPDVAIANARSENVSLREELDRLVVHGVLHVLGYEHPESAARTGSRMWRKQESILERIRK